VSDVGYWADYMAVEHRDWGRCRVLGGLHGGGGSRPGTM